MKVAAAETGGAYTSMEDNLKASFALGLHRHETHAETFYFLDGEVDFYADGDWHRCGPGTAMHVPPGDPMPAKRPVGNPPKCR